MIKALAAQGHILELFLPFRRVGTYCVEVSKLQLAFWLFPSTAIIIGYSMCGFCACYTVKMRWLF